jgi:hypothetical protein
MWNVKCLHSGEVGENRVEGCGKHRKDLKSSRRSMIYAIFHPFFIDNKEREKTSREVVAKFDVDKLKISSTLEIHEGSFNT